MGMPTFDLQPQIFCRVVNVQLLANKDNDEVYTQLTLLPQPQLVGMNLESKELQDLGLGMDEEGGGGLPTKSTPHMFCKTLTASDTHGGFSVPRRSAEDCFPPLVIMIINCKGHLKSLLPKTCTVWNGGFDIFIEVSQDGICLLQDGVSL